MRRRLTRRTPQPRLARGPAPRAALGLEQVDAVPVTGKQLEPAMRQGLGENFLVFRSDPTLITAQQQHWRPNSGEERPYIDPFETLMQGRGDIGAGLVHLGDAPSRSCSLACSRSSR